MNHVLRISPCLAILLESGKADLLRHEIESTDDPVAVATVKALGSVGTSEAITMIQPLIRSDMYSSAVRNQAVRSLGGSREGEAFLLNLF